MTDMKYFIPADIVEAVIGSELLIPASLAAVITKE